MYFEEKDIELKIDGMGIVFYSPQTNKDIPVGYDFLGEEYTEPVDVANHIKQGDMVGFCTGTGGDFCLKFRKGYPKEEFLIHRKRMTWEQMRNLWGRHLLR